MSRTHRFLGGVTFGYLSLAVPTIAGLWLTPFILGRLGHHDYGLWLLTAQILGYLSLLDIGVVALLPRETAYLTGRSDAAPLDVSVPPLVARTLMVVLFQLPFVAAVGLLVLVLLPADWAALKWPLAVVLAAFVLVFPLRIFSAILQGLQELAFLGKLQVVCWSLGTAASVALLLAGAGLYSVAAGAVTTQVLFAGGTSALVAVRYRHLLPGRLSLGDRRALRAQVTSGIWVSISQVAQVLLYGTDLVIIGRVFGPAAVVPYSCTGKLVTVLMNQPQVLTAAAAPALSELRALGDRDRLREVSGTLSLATMIVSGAVFCSVLAVNRGFVTWWVGPAQYSGDALTMLFLVNMLGRHLNVALTQALFCFGYERRLSIVALCDGFVTVGSALVLARLLGPSGAIIGSIAGLSLVSLPVNLATLAGELGLSVPRTVRSLSPWAWRFGAILVAMLLLPNQSMPAGFVRLGVVGTLVLGLYAVVMVPVGTRGPLGAYVRPLLSEWRQRLGDAGRRLGRPRRVVGSAPIERP